MDEASETLYGLLPLGVRVAGHPGITHGGVSAFVCDEMGGQAYVAFFQKTRGPGFTARLELNYRAPLPAGTFVLATVRTEARPELRPRCKS